MIAALSLVRSSPLALGDEIARLAAQIDAATHQLLTCIRKFDESGEWHTQGAQSCAHWLSWRIGLDLGTAREQVRVARALGRLPALDAALSRAQLSYSKVRAITRVATPETEQRLVEYAGHTTGAQLERICRRFRRARHEIDGVLVTPDQRGVNLRPLSDGLVRVEVTLHPDEAALVMKAIEKARDHLGASAETRPSSRDISAETPSHPRASGSPLPSRADAAVHLAEQFLAASPSTLRGDTNYQVFVHMDQSALAPDNQRDAFLEDGTRISAETFRRITCDAALVGVAMGPDGTPLNVGRRTRTIPPAIRRALLLRDAGCRFPGCTNHRFVHAHHIHHWLHGGATSLANLITLCAFHHHLLHEGGLRIERDAADNVWFCDRDGSSIPNTPPLPTSPTLVDDTADFESRHCGWDGDQIDYDAAVDALIVADLRPRDTDTRTPEAGGIGCPLWTITPHRYC
jgi:hypothetical protein